MFSERLNNFSTQFYKFCLEKVLDNLSLGFLILDENFKIIYWSKGAEKITGYSSKDLRGKDFENISILEIYQKNEEVKFGSIINKYSEIKPKAIIYLRHKSNYRFPIRINFFHFYDEKNKKDLIIGIFTILDMVYYTKKLIKSLKEKAYKDSLTLLPNRRFMEYIICKKIEEFSRYDLNFGLILFDINNFKSINDCFGHKAGDKVLKDFSTFIKNSLRKCDFFGRWGGDEFVAIIINIDSYGLKSISDKLVKVIERKIFKEKKQKFHIFVSAGFTLVEKNDTLETLINRADMNMYKEKFKNINP